jgi:hypothetical protein
MATIGLETFDELGNPTMAVTDRITKILGTIDTGLSDGSLDVPDLLKGRGWVRAVAYTNTTSPASEIGATVYIDDNKTTIRWYFTGGQDVNPPFSSFRNTKITYGIW